MKHVMTIDIDGHRIELETGRIARQANGAVLIRQGRTVLLVTATAAAEAREGADFFPLTAEYREQTAAVGKIPGGYLKREGRLSDAEVLTSRIIDRSVRPLFPDGYRNEVQVVATVLAAEEDADTAPLAILGATAALHLSDIPFNGPAGGLTVVRTDGVLKALPTRIEQDQADLTMTVSMGPDGLVMVEGALDVVPEGVVLDALDHVEKALQPFRDGMKAWREECGRNKRGFAAPVEDEALMTEVRERWGSPVQEALAIEEKAARKNRLGELKEEAIQSLCKEDEDRVPGVKAGFENLVYRLVRELALDQGKRIGGRGFEDIRDIWGEVGWLETNHGSAIFCRGETQALASCTLGSSEDEQRVDRLHGEERSSFLLHYNFPPYSVGETRPLRGPGRREIGHGNLARRALVPVLPVFSDFPYTIRLISNITESNGSSSMATVCGGCLALMDSGVPIKAPVAGIAMGLISGLGGDIAILSDILGDEDHLGDMDFKVTGTEAGITALQMDNKIGGLRRDVLERALEQARKGRLHILDRMKSVLPAPRDELPEQAPRVMSMQIRPERIRDLIGPKGAMIQEIQNGTNTRVSVNDTGQVLLYSTRGTDGDRARRWVHWVAGDPEVGKLYQGVVVTVRNFGAFVRILNNTEGLVHISELAEERVNEATDVVNDGDEVVVRVLGVNDQGKISLSLKEALNAGVEDVIRPVT